MRDIDLIKQKIDIVEFIRDYVDLKKSGRNFKGLCPFHTEKTPSFYVSPDRQIWHCFGACDEGGDLFSFYMKAENVSFPEALTELAKQANIKLTSRFEHDHTWREKNRLYEINHLTFEYYHYLLTKHKIGKKALTYLHNRNINEKIISTFGLGYAPSGWRNLFRFLTKKGYKEKEIEKAGLIIQGKSNWYDRFRKRIIFPLKDHRSNIVGFSGRLISATQKGAKYINTPETPLYHKGSLLYGLDITQNEIRKQNSVIICEGEFDVLSSYQHGISNIVAIKGTALTQDQLTLLGRYTKNILLALDMDPAGNSASHRSIELAEKMDFTMKVVLLSSGKDLDEGLQKNPSAVKKAIKNAPTVYDFILTSAVKKYPGDDASSKKQIASEVLPFFAKIKNTIIREFFVKKLAQILDVSEEAVMEQLLIEQKKLKTLPVTSPTIPHKNTKPFITRLEEYLLSLIIQSKNPAKYLQKLTKTIKIDDIETPAVRKVMVLLKGNKKIPEELAHTYNRAYLYDIHTVLSNTDTFESEFKETITNIKKHILRKKLKKIAKKLQLSDQNESLNKTFINISEELKKLEAKQ